LVRSFKRPAARRKQDSGRFLLLSRVFVWLVALLLAVIPWSERYSMLDNFPHGQDTEFSILAFLIFLGLMLLLARSRTSILGALIRWHEAVSALVGSGCTLIRAIELSLPLEYGPEHAPGPPLAAFDIPLQI
jgi:hypothetical protein